MAWRFDQSAKQLLVGHTTNHYATMLFILLLLLNYKFWNDVPIYCRPNCQYNTDFVVFWYSIMTVLYYFCCRMSIYWREMPLEPWHFVNWGIYWMHTHTHTRLTALCPGLPRSAGTRKVKPIWILLKVKPIWILLKQKTVSGNGISWTICKSAPRSRQITTPAPHHSSVLRPHALPAAQPTVSKHWRHWVY